MAEDHIYRTSVHGNPNIGLYGFCTNEYCIVGREIRPEQAAKIEKVLKVPTHRMNIAGSGLVGAFLVGNNKCLLVPNIILEDEIEQLKKLKIEFEIIDSNLTALGNNITCNDTGCLVNPEYSAVVKKKIRQALGVPLKPGKIADVETVGSVTLTTNNKGLCHRDISDAEKTYAEELLGVKLAPGTVNFGNPYIRAGILANKNGFVIGNLSGGPEMTYVDEELGFLR